MDSYWLMFFFKIIWKSWQFVVWLWTLLFKMLLNEPHLTAKVVLLSVLCAIPSSELIGQKFWDCCTFPNPNALSKKKKKPTINCSQVCTSHYIGYWWFKIKKTTVAPVSMLVLLDYSPHTSKSACLNVKK